MYTITRKYSFCAAHRIEGHPKCGRLHGHNYEVVVAYAGKILPGDGMLIDYGELDKIVKPIVDSIDHRYIVSRSNHNALDPYAVVAQARGDAFLLDAPASTAEFLARFLWHEVFTDLRATIYGCARNELVITVNETPKSTATYVYEAE